MNRAAVLMLLVPIAGCLGDEGFATDGPLVGVTDGKPPSAADAGRHAHYEACLKSPHLHASFSLRETAQYKAHSSRKATGRVTYDAVFDAAKLTIPKGSDKLGTKDYLVLPFAELTKSADREISVQWEARWSSSYLGVKPLGLTTHKAFRLNYHGPPVNERRVELQTRFGRGDPSAVALPTIRTYRLPTLAGDRDADPISFQEDWQPGGAAAPFYIQPDVWNRFTVSITWNGGDQRIRLWAADENHDPVLIIADPADPSKGFLADNPDASLVGFNRFLVLFDSSQNRTGGSALESWVRNVVIFKDASVPLGGRPDSSSQPGS